MEIVINISEEDFKSVENKIFTVGEMSETTQGRIYCAIVNGKPLPKGHGRLGDLDAVMSDICSGINTMTNIGIAVDDEYLWGKLNDAIDNAPTIIEADEDKEVNADADSN